MRRMFSHLAADVNRNTDDHCRDSDACDESDPDRRSDQRSQLPQDLLLPAPRLLPPKCAAGRTDGGNTGGEGMRITHTNTHTLINTEVQVCCT